MPKTDVDLLNFTQMDVFFKNGSRYNLINSAVIEVVCHACPQFARL